MLPLIERRMGAILPSPNISVVVAQSSLQSNDWCMNNCSLWFRKLLGSYPRFDMDNFHKDSAENRETIIDCSQTFVSTILIISHHWSELSLQWIFSFKTLTASKEGFLKYEITPRKLIEIKLIKY